jgi:hypothetical protein
MVNDVAPQATVWLPHDLPKMAMFPTPHSRGPKGALLTGEKFR